jgi:hypothetical protein
MIDQADHQESRARADAYARHARLVRRHRRVVPPTSPCLVDQAAQDGAKLGAVLRGV